MFALVQNEVKFLFVFYFFFLLEEYTWFKAIIKIVQLISLLSYESIFILHS